MGKPKKQIEFRLPEAKKDREELIKAASDDYAALVDQEPKAPPIKKKSGKAAKQSGSIQAGVLDPEGGTKPEDSEVFDPAAARGNVANLTSALKDAKKRKR